MLSEMGVKMELPKYIQDKIKQQNEACFRAAKLEREIDNWVLYFSVHMTVHFL